MMIALLVAVGISHLMKAKRFLMIEIIGYIFGIGFLIWLIVALALYAVANHWMNK